MKKIAIWIPHSRFDNLVYNFKDNDEVKFFYFVQKDSEILKNKRENVFIASTKENVFVNDTLIKNDISHIFMTHISQDFFKICKAKKYFISHGFYDFGPEIISDEFRNNIDKFDKFFMAGNVSKSMFKSKFNIPEDKFVVDIYLPFDKIYDVYKLPEEKRKRPNILLFDSSIGKYDSGVEKRMFNKEFFNILMTLDQICKENGFDLSIKEKNYTFSDTISKYKKTSSIVSEGRVKFFKVGDLSYLRKSDLFFIIRSPSLEIECLPFLVPQITLREPKVIHNNISKYGLSNIIETNNVNYKTIRKVIFDALKNKVNKSKVDEYFKYLGMKLDGNNFDRLNDFILKKI